MEFNRKSSRLARKPLSDCSNTRYNFPNSKLISQTLANKTKINYNYNNINGLSSINSHTSTGSNNSSVFDCVSSQSPTPITRPGDVDDWKSRPSAHQIQTQDQQTRKCRKSVVPTSIVNASVQLPSRTPQISAVSANEGHVTSPTVKNRKVDEQERKDRIKQVAETPAIHLSTPLTSHTLQTLSAASGNDYVPGSFAVHSQKLDRQANTNIRKIVQLTPNIESPDPTTPPSLVISSSSASGTDDQERTESIAYDQRRTSQRKNLADGGLSAPFSCAPNKGTKTKWLELDNGSGDGHSGSHTDPLLLHKKKRLENKKNNSMHTMTEAEVDKLKAYYADIDEFELPEEIVSEGELE